MAWFDVERLGRDGRVCGRRRRVGLRAEGYDGVGGGVVLIEWGSLILHRCAWFRCAMLGVQK